MKTINFGHIGQGYAVAHAEYMKRTTKPNLAKTGIQSDIQAGLNQWSKFTAAQWSACAALFDADTLSMIEKTGNVKTLLRLPSLIEFCITGDRRALQGSAKVAVAALVGLGTGAKTREALSFASTGRGNEHTSDVIDTAKSALVRKALGFIVGPSTEPTQYSVAFGDGNLCDMLRTAHKPAVRALPILNRASPVYIAIAKHVNAMTERDLLAWVEETEQKGAQKGKGARKGSK